MHYLSVQLFSIFNLEGVIYLAQKKFGTSPTFPLSLTSVPPCSLSVLFFVLQRKTLVTFPTSPFVPDPDEVKLLS